MKELSGHVALFREQLTKIEALPLQGEYKEEIQTIHPALDAYINSGEALAGMVLDGELEAVARFEGFVAAFKKLEVEMAH
ncbi:MAG: hypothetical protein MPW15_19625 [Candidatus Manganitrophus sp.]|nr:hypothetical protein [Candidatus Manganitrophus sp.]